MGDFQFYYIWTGPAGSTANRRPRRSDSMYKPGKWKNRVNMQQIGKETVKLNKIGNKPAQKISGLKNQK